MLCMIANGLYLANQFLKSTPLEWVTCIMNPSMSYVLASILRQLRTVQPRSQALDVLDTSYPGYFWTLFIVHI
jgi:hypothetical protein